MGKNKKNAKKNQKPPAAQAEKSIEPPLSAEVLAEMAAVEGAGTAEKDDQGQDKTAAIDEQAGATGGSTASQELPETEKPTPTAKIIWPDGYTTCPRCLTGDTVAYSTNGKIQYRKCRRGVCRHRFTVRGRRGKS